MIGLSQHNHIRKIEHVYLYFCLTVITIGCLLLGYWLLIPDDIMEIKSVVVSKEIYHPGDRIVYKLSYCKYKQIPGDVIRALVNGTRTSFTTTTGNLPVGCHTATTSDLIIPDYVDSDTYHLEGTIVYQINPIRKEYVFWKSQDFKVK